MVVQLHAWGFISSIRSPRTASLILGRLSASIGYEDEGLQVHRVAVLFQNVVEVCLEEFPELQRNRARRDSLTEQCLQYIDCPEETGIVAKRKFAISG